MAGALPPPSMEEAQIQLIFRYYELMKLYIEERIAEPYNEDVTTTKFLKEVISSMSDTVPAMSDPAPLMDAILLAKCFAATALMPSDRSEQVPLLLDWVHSYESDLDGSIARMRDQIMSSKQADGDFWQFLLHCTITGQFSEAAELIDNSVLAGNEDVDLLSGLIASYPVDSDNYAGFMHWRENVVLWYNALLAKQLDDRRLQDHLETLGLVLAGDAKVISLKAKNWVAAIAGLYLYSDPTPESLEAHFNVAIAEHQVNVIPTWEEGCKNLFEDRVVAALGCLRLLDIGSAVAISEFCSERGLLQKYGSGSSGKAGGGVREELALTYIATCLAEPPLVEIGAEMLVNIGTSQAKETARLLLPQLVERSPEFADLAIDTADQLGLEDVRVELSRLAAHRALEKRAYLPAIDYFYRANDYVQVKDSAWNLFKELLVTKEATGDAATLSILRESNGINDLELPMMIKDNLAPSAVLLALLDSLQVEDVEGILTNLDGLLTFPDPPLQYYPLIVALVSGVSGAVLTLKYMTMLMSALDLWDSASEATKFIGYDIIAEAATHPNWHPTLGETQDPKKLVWLLRRQLAKEVCL